MTIQGGSYVALHCVVCQKTEIKGYYCVQLSVIHARSLTAVSDLKRHGLVCLSMNDSHAAIQACNAYIRAFMNRSINGWVLSETQNGMFTKNADTVLAQFRLNSVWLSKWHTAKHWKKMLGYFVIVKSPWRFLKATKCNTIVNHSHASI